MPIDLARKAATAKAYNASEAGKERWRRYAQTEKGKATRNAARARYSESSKGKETKRENNARRMFTNKIYVGMFGFTKRELEEMKTSGKID